MADEENPFGGEPTEETPFDKPSIPPSAPSPPPLSSSSFSRQSRLDAIRAREAELRDREERLRDTRAEIIPEPNFPPFFPLIVFDLDRDIPKRAHGCLNCSLTGFGLVFASVFFNLLAILSVRGLYGYKHLRSIIFGIIQGFGTGYVIFNYSFLRLYHFCRKRDIPFSWIVTQFLIVAWLVYLAIGFPDSGCVGLATFLDLLAKSKSKFSMIVAALNTGLIIAAAYFQFVTLYKAQAYQKVSGADDNQVPQQLRV
jgi:hypothetical protein